MSDLKFITCTQAQYSGQKSGETLVPGALYFAYDTRRVYRATASNNAEMYGQPYEVVESFPESNQKQGTLYINSSTKEVQIYNGTSMITVSYPVTTTVNSSSTDLQIPTAKAVYDAIPKTGTNQGQIPILGTDGKLPNSVMPEISITRRAGAVTSKADLVTLTNAEVGDYAIVSGTESDDGVYFLNGTYSTLSDWLKISGTGSTITLDSAPTEDSSNGVTSDGIFTALQGKSDTNHTHSYSDLTSKLAWETL